MPWRLVATRALPALPCIPLALTPPPLPLLTNTTPVDSATEAALYAALRQQCSCYISIGHRQQLTAYHTHVLAWQGGGHWALSTAADYVRQLPRELSPQQQQQQHKQ